MAIWRGDIPEQRREPGSGGESGLWGDRARWWVAAGPGSVVGRLAWAGLHLQLQELPRGRRALESHLGSSLPPEEEDLEGSEEWLLGT